jgi:hypothetical protein
MADPRDVGLGQGTTHRDWTPLRDRIPIIVPTESFVRLERGLTLREAPRSAHGRETSPCNGPAPTKV